MGFIPAATAAANAAAAAESVEADMSDPWTIPYGLKSPSCPEALESMEPKYRTGPDEEESMEPKYPDAPDEEESVEL